MLKDGKELDSQMEEGRFATLPDRSRRPKETHNLEREKVDQTMGIRDRQGYGCSKIAFDVECSSSTVHKYLRIHPKSMKRVNKRRFRSFERKHSNSMWQMANYAVIFLIIMYHSTEVETYYYLVRKYSKKGWEMCWSWK
jgi:hypothetical protein